MAYALIDDRAPRRPTRTPDLPEIAIAGVTARISPHDEHGSVVYWDGHRDEYQTREQFLEFLAALQRLVPYLQ